MKKQLIAMLLTACLGVTVLGGCGSSKESGSDSSSSTENAQTTTDNAQTTDNAESTDTSSTGEPKEGGILKFATHSPVANPGYTPEVTNNAGLIYLTTAYESLIYYDEQGNIIPKLATEWTTDANEPSITWTLREGVKFADGTDFNAEAVKRNIEEYQKCERNETKNIKECQVIDNTHIKMVLNNWNSSQLEFIGFFVYYMSPTAMENVDELRNSSCGTGPFQVTEFQSGVVAKYAKNENYWQEGKPYLDGVEISIVSEPTTIASAFEANEYDMVILSNLTVANDLINKGKFIMNENTSGQGLVSTGLIPNSADSSSPFADYKVRQAMCYAIDSQALTTAFGYGLIEPTNQWAAPGAVTYDPHLKSFDYNPEKAKELLTEAGYPDGFDTVLTTDAGSKDMMTAAANMLEEVGIHCEIELVDGSTATNLYMTGTWKGIMGHYASIAPDLGLYMGRHLDVDGAFYAKGIQHPQEAMDLLEKIRTAPTDTEKIKLQYEMQNLIYDSETGLALFGKLLYMQNEPKLKWDYVKGDNFGVCHASTWNIENCWLDK